VQVVASEGVVVPPDRANLTQLYCDFRQQLFTCALAVTGSPSRAEDAVHDAFFRMLRRQDAAGNRVTDLKAYVFRAVRNASFDQLRRLGPPREPLPDYVFDPASGPAATAEDADFKRQIVELLARLSPDERETIVLHLYGDLTFQEIATIREAPMGTVVTWYRRGLDKLRRKLEVPDGTV
jgi:RNA polymerase sigma-70 factor (ECF subfamily)